MIYYKIKTMFYFTGFKISILYVIKTLSFTGFPTFGLHTLVCLYNYYFLLMTTYQSPTLLIVLVFVVINIM